ncbi:MAG: cyclase family protein [Burkholderiaceae bacterium]
MNPTTYPLYRDLPVNETTGEPHAWQCFGPGDELGTMNFIGAAQVQAALRSAAEGRVVNLDLPLDLPQPALSRGRAGYVHHIKRTRGGGDDHLDNFYLQCSSQWDAVAHIRYREFGFYGGRQDADLDRGELGIDRLARKGMVGRGVLVDFCGWMESRKSPIRATERLPITPADMSAVLDWQGTKLQQGDILLVRTGWLRWYLNLDEAGRIATGGTLHNEEGGLDCPGLASGTDMAEWLWNHRVAAVAADNPALEVLKIRKEDGFLHRRIMALLGMPIGEFWYLEELAHACFDRGRHDFLLTSAPLNLPRGVGSPANAYAIL